MRCYRFTNHDILAILNRSSFEDHVRNNFLSVLERSGYLPTELVHQVFNECVPTYFSLSDEEYLNGLVEEEEACTQNPGHSLTFEPVIQAMQRQDYVVHLVEDGARVGDHGFHELIYEYLPTGYEDFTRNIYAHFSCVDREAGFSEVTQTLGYIIAQVESICLRQVFPGYTASMLFVMQNADLVVFVQ